MEQDLLANMLVERDSQISTLTQKLHQTQDSLHSLQKELHQKSQQRQKQREEHSAAIRKLKEEHTEQRRLLAKYEQSVKNGGGLRVHEYAALMRSANQEGDRVDEWVGKRGYGEEEFAGGDGGKVA